MKLSVVLACRNGAQTIADQLEALARQECAEPWEVVVVDNGSSDNTVVIVERYRGRLPSLRIVDASDRPGAAYAQNVGVAAARGNAVAFCDADDEVAPNWVAAMREALSRYDFVACRTETEKLNPPWTGRARRNVQGNGIPQYTYPPYLPHAGAGTLGVKRSVHQAVGGFDETLPALHDTDYCWKIQLAGVKLHFVPDAVVHIRYRHTLRGMFRQARRWGEYNVVLYKRYRPLGMPALSWKDGVVAWRGLLRALLRVRTRADLAKWVWGFGWRLGRLQGSVRNGVFAL